MTLGISERTTASIREVLGGQRHGIRAALLFAGPAIMASIAYVDPGNFATNIQAGARYGYALLWVVLLANGIAMLFQAMSARLGVVTNRNLAELCRAHFPRPLVVCMWLVSEVAAMATDLAEFLGGALGLALLFHLPLLAGMLITGVITYALLSLDRAGYRPIELVIGGLIGLIGLCYLIELALAPPHWGQVALHTMLPTLPDTNAVTLAVGIIGATVMPHAIFLHSGLTQGRAPARDATERRKLIIFSNRETVLALTLAGAINMAMVMMAAAVFHGGHADIADIGTAYHTLIPLLGAGAAGVFLVALMASGISSSAIGTMAGQMIMQGFVGFHIPVWLRRLATMLPAFIIVALGYNVTQSLIISQVVLSLVLPVPMVSLLLLSRRADIMGAFRVRGLTLAAGTLGALIILVLNAVLLAQTLGWPIPGLPAG